MSDQSTSLNQPMLTLDQSIHILEAMSDAFLFLDTQWRIVYLNQQAEPILQHKREELLGNNIWEVFPEAIGSSFYSYYHEAATTQKPVQFIEFYPPLSKWVEVHVYPSPQGLSVYLIDVTQRVQAEEALRNSEERFRSIWEHARDAMALSDSEGTILTANPAYYHLYGYSSEEVIGKSFAIIYPEDQREWAMAEYHRTFQQPEIASTVEATIRRKDGTERIVESRYHFVFQNAQRLAMVSIVRDITEQKREQEALQRLQVRSQRLMESSIIGVFIADNSYILESNDAFLEMISSTRDEFNQSKINWSAITPPEYAPLDQRKLEELREHGAYMPYEKEYFRKDGSRIPILIGATLLQEEPQQWVCFILDISERKKLEQRKDEFISIASHELRTPITTLKALTQIQKKKFEKQGAVEIVLSLSKMEAQINKITKLIADLLDVSKIQAGKLDYAAEDVALDAVIHDSVETMQQVSTTHVISVHGASNKHIVGDKDRLEQVFTNLISNAIKYSPKADIVAIHITTTQQAVIVRVQDYGIGIPKQHQRKIFDRFYRVSDGKTALFPGLGMGLFISAEIVIRHGGNIMVESEEGKGAAFIVTLPVKKV